MFLVEQAWWYYEDQARPAAKERGVELTHYGSYATFAQMLFRRVPEAAGLVVSRCPGCLQAPTAGSLLDVQAAVPAGLHTRLRALRAQQFLNDWLTEYRKYKQGIPVYGAIMLDASMERVRELEPTLSPQSPLQTAGTAVPQQQAVRPQRRPLCACRCCWCVATRAAWAGPSPRERSMRARARSTAPFVRCGPGLYAVDYNAGQ